MTLTQNLRDGQAGSALVYVLWVAAAIALVLAAATAAVNSQLRLVAVERQSAEADLAMRSALDLVAFDAALIGRSYLESLPVTITIDDVAVEVSLADSHRKLDINMADDRRWVAFLIRQGVTEERARMMADRILDWRDTDVRPRDFGGEAELYTDLPIGNRPFRSVSELSKVVGVSEREVACWAGHLTVYGGTPAPEIDASDFGSVISMDGVRAALKARRERPDGRGFSQMSALVLFGGSPVRPFEWVAFGVDETEQLQCSSDGQADGDTAG